MLRGSAVCTVQETVCMDAECETVDDRNLCMMGARQAFFDITMTIALLILFSAVATVQGKVSAALDESLQTAQDYSVRPPTLF